MAEVSRAGFQDALSGITRRLDELAATLARLAPPPEPAARIGVPLGEAERQALSAVEALLAVGPAAGRETALVLAVDRVVQRAGADCAAVFVPAADGPLTAVAHRGLEPDAARVAVGPGIVDRAFREREVIVAGAGDAEGDPLLRAHALGQAVAVPGRPAGGAAPGVRF